MKTWWVVAFSVLISLLAVGVLLLVGRQPRGEAIQLLPPPTPEPLTVYVAGAVTHPGVYQLPAGSRVRDVVEQAGGLLPEADDQALNLAALLKDGSMLRVPVKSSEQTHDPGSLASGIVTGDILNLNTASTEELQILPGIGPVLAQRIIDYRSQFGPFTSVEELLEVDGIGPVIFDEVKDLVSVDIFP